MALRLLTAIILFGACEHGRPTTISVGVGGDGVITSSPAGISCPPTCTASFDAETTVSLRAAAVSGSRFLGFAGDCTGTACQVFAPAAGSRAQVIATFTSCAGGASSCTDLACGYFCTYSTCGNGVSDPGELCPGARATLAVPPLAAGASLVDLDHDGDLDVVTTETDTSLGNQPTTVDVLWNDGKAGFTLETGLSGIDPITFVDVTGDGFPDLVGSQDLSRKGPLLVQVNDGTGHFGAPISSSLPFPGYQIAPGDFDGDGDVDLAIAQTGHQSVIVFNDGTGRFSNPQTLSTPFDVQSLATADLDGDGIPDVFTGCADCLDQQGNGTTDSIEVWTSRSKFAPPAIIRQGQAPVALDLDGDGDLDLVASIADPSFVFLGPGLAVAWNDGTGAFSPLEDLYQLSLPTEYWDTLPGLSLLDVDGDGVPEVLSDGLVFWRDGARFSSAAKIFPDLPGATLGDLDGDGQVDAVTIGGGTFSVELGGR
jgi:hypothetical protein